MRVEKGRDVVEFEWKPSRVAEEVEVMALLAGGLEAFYRRAARRVLAEHGDIVYLNRCPRCHRLIRTPKARQCSWCGNDWHGVEG